MGECESEVTERIDVGILSHGGVRVFTSDLWDLWDLPLLLR